MAVQTRQYRLLPAGEAAPALPLAGFPAAPTDGLILRPAELPRVELQAFSGLWLPRGGRQLLAQRTRNPVTVQSTTLVSAETIGPFPGGLVRAGMRLRFDAKLSQGGVGSPTGAFRFRVGAGPLTDANNFARADVSAGLNTAGFVSYAIDVLSDSLATHLGGMNGNAGVTITSAFINPLVDFSQDWVLEPWLSGGLETAVNITGATWSAGVATFTTSAPHTLAVGDKDEIAGVTPAGWNTTAIVSAVPDTTHFSVPMAANPGAYTSGGTTRRISNMILLAYQLTLEG